MKHWMLSLIARFVTMLHLRECPCPICREYRHVIIDQPTAKEST